MIKNDYYGIACNELNYLESVLPSIYYNPLVVQVQQIAEKMLKSVANSMYTDIETLLHGHNLRQLYLKIHEGEPEFILDAHKLSTLKDYYFDAKYPGDNFVTVTAEEFDVCLDTMYDVIEQVNNFRKKLNLDVITVQRKTNKTVNESVVFKLT